MDVVVITSSKALENEVYHLEKLFSSGLKTLHLRKPKWSQKEIEKLIQSLPKDYQERIVIHGHYKLAFKYNLKGIHLHRKHRSSSFKNRWRRFLMKLRRPSIQIIATFNSLESLRENKEKFDYVFLSSVFNSHSYYNRDEEAGMNMLKAIIEDSSSPVFALGGVDASKMPVVEEAGFSGVGLSSAVWKNLGSNSLALLSLINAA